MCIYVYINKYNEHLCNSVQSDVAVNQAAGGVHVRLYIYRYTY